MKAQQYNLNFRIIQRESESYPIIECGKDSQGSSINIELAEFIGTGGVKYTQEVVADINSLDFTQADSNGLVYEIHSYFNEHLAEFFGSPNRASFWNGTSYIDIPIQDFLDILQEWIDFLNSISFEHRLSNR